MNKNAIQKFAIWARNELIAQVSQRAYQYGIDESGFGDASADTLNGRLLTAEEKSQRQELIKKTKEKGYKQVMEEVSYTWFNRFIALRFMEVNNYLPSHIRVFSDASGAFKPEILNDVLHLDLPGLDSGKVAEYIESNDTEALYRYLLLTQCNALNSALPVMFERMGGYTEMLLPNNILRQDSVLGHMVSDIPEEDWQDAVQIIGWLYQYYNTELKDDTFAQLKKNVKITKERIPAATQLFTPDWIVRYMVENSLGRLWLEGHPNAELHDGWKYYLDEAEQEPEVEAQLAKLREEYKTIKPEEFKVIDPCMGSGHILVYAFDVLMQIYTSAGWDQREAAQSILKNNLYGLDIDDRAAQLAYFAVMMKARQYDRRLLTRGIQPNIHSIIESNALGGAYKLAMGDFLLSKEHQETLNYLLDAFIDAKEYGSILCLEKRDYVGLLRAWNLTASQTTENLNLTLWFAAVEHVFTKEQLEEVLKFALEMRRRVKEQLKKLGGMEFYDVNFSYIDNDTFEEHFVSVPEQGGGKLIPEGMCNPGQVYTVSQGKSGMIGVFRLESQMLPGSGKFERTGLNSDGKCKEAANTAFNYLKANGNRISGAISTTTNVYWYDGNGEMIAAGMCAQWRDDSEFMLKTFSQYYPSGSNKGQTFHYGNGDNNSGSIRDDYGNPEDLWEDNQDWYEDEDEAWDEWENG